MNKQDIIQQRLANQHLAGNPLATADQVVSWLGAVQAQDFAGVKWAVGQRVQGADDAAIEAAFNEGAILRTHAMRPTWHFVAPADLRWLQELTAPRVHVVNGTMYRKLELDQDLFRRSNNIISKALEDGRFLTREELGSALSQAGIPVSGNRLAYIIMHAELDALICSGPRRGKQFTYALLADRAPQAKSLPYEETLAELTRRYFSSHGPAMVEDCAWWSGLTKAQVQTGLELVKADLQQEIVNGQSYWLAPNLPQFSMPSPTVHLLPNYDEYLISYRDSSPVLDPAYLPLVKFDDRRFTHFLVCDGRVIGLWRRDIKKETVTLTLKPFVPLSKDQEEAVWKSAEIFKKFSGVAELIPARA